MSVAATDAGDLYSIDQSDDVVTFLLGFGLDTGPIRSSPMHNLNLLLSDTIVLGPNSSNWCKSAIDVLHFLARGTGGSFSVGSSIASNVHAALFFYNCNILGVKIIRIDPLELNLWL